MIRKTEDASTQTVKQIFQHIGISPRISAENLIVNSLVQTNPLRFNHKSERVVVMTAISPVNSAGSKN